VGGLCVRCFSIRHRLWGGVISLRPTVFSIGARMNPVKEIGRHQLPILNVASITRREGIGLALSQGVSRIVDLINDRFKKNIAWRVNAYDVALINGRQIKFTDLEKQTYDEELAFHEEVMRVWGMCKSAGL